MRIGILGCGYVGQAAALHWKKLGHKVSVSTRRAERVAPLQDIADEVYLLKPHTIGEFFSSQEALLISVAPTNSSDYTSTYLQTAQVVADECATNQNLKMLLYTSSLSVYGDHQGRWVDETTTPNPQNENAQILLETENVLMGCTSNRLNLCIFRLGEIYGPGREIEGRLRQRAGQPFPGSGDSYTNLIHLDDIVSALHFALEHRLTGIYNLCNDFHVPRKDFYDTICQQANLPPIQWDPSRQNPHAGNRRVSNQKLKQNGFVFSYPLWSL